MSSVALIALREIATGAMICEARVIAGKGGGGVKAGRCDMSGPAGPITHKAVKNEIARTAIAPAILMINAESPFCAPPQTLHTIIRMMDLRAPRNCGG